MRRRIGDHVVCRNGGRTYECLNCGQKYDMNLPVLLSVYVAAMKEFAKIHRHCKPKGGA